MHPTTNQDAEYLVYYRETVFKAYGGQQTPAALMEHPGGFAPSPWAAVLGHHVGAGAGIGVMQHEYAHAHGGAAMPMDLHVPQPFPYYR